MRTVKLIDMTLSRSSAIRGSVLSFKEKLEIAKLLDLNESTVRGRLKAAREKMERQYCVVTGGTKKKRNEIPKNRFTAPMKLAE